MISVIIPAKNAEETLEGCLAAVLGQKGVDDSYEVILVGDGSTDRTGEIVEGGEGAGERVNFVHIGAKETGDMETWWKLDRKMEG